MPSRCPKCHSYDTYTIVKGRPWNLFLISAFLGILTVDIAKDAVISRIALLDKVVYCAFAIGLVYAAYAALFKWRREVTKCQDCNAMFNGRTKW